MTGSMTYVKVLFRNELDGVYAHSQDLPGLSIWGKTYDEACDRVKAGIRLLYRANWGKDVQVTEAADLELEKKSCDAFIVAQAA